tara:strand:+ start:1064 stop:1483 length:420 start_codon:yes stop_codon:yes gene_type:complete
MKYSLSDAAQATGKNKTTIQRAIKSGKISAVKGNSGAYEIDPAELHRVFPPATAQRDAQQYDVTLETNASARISELEKELAVAQSRSISLEEQRQQMSETIEDLRARLDRSEDRITALTDQRGPEARNQKGWFARVLGF